MEYETGYSSGKADVRRMTVKTKLYVKEAPKIKKKKKYPTL